MYLASCMVCGQDVEVETDGDGHLIEYRLGPCWGPKGECTTSTRSNRVNSTRKGMKSHQRSPHGKNIPINLEREGKKHINFLRARGYSWGQLANKLAYPSPQAVKVMLESRGSMKRQDVHTLRELVEEEKEKDKETKTKETEVPPTTKKDRSERLEAAMKKAKAAGVSKDDIALGLGYKRTRDLDRIISTPGKSVPVSRIKRLERNMEALISGEFQKAQATKKEEEEKKPEPKEEEKKITSTKTVDGFAKIQAVIDQVRDAKDRWYEIVEELPEDLRKPFIDKGECLQMFLGGLTKD